MVDTIPYYLKNTNDCDDESNKHPGSDEDDELCGPLLRVKLLATSDNFCDRQRTFKILPDLFNKFPAEHLIKELPEIMKTLLSLAEDVTLQYDLLCQIPTIAAAAQEAAIKSSRNELKDIVCEYLVPHYVRHLGCPEMAVPYDVLLQLIKQNFINKLQIEIQVCPTILAISKDESATDVVTRTIWFICQLGPYLGYDAMERVFLKRFIELCSSQMLCVRKSCAANLANFAVYISKDSFKKNLFPCFLKLCEDEMCDVRKSCAEIMMLISLMCDLNTRHTILAPIFIKLLEDDNNWVKFSAYQTLGPFIATFADPPITKLSTEHDRCTLTNCDGIEFLIPNSSIDFARMCDFDESSLKFPITDFELGDGSNSLMKFLEDEEKSFMSQYDCDDSKKINNDDISTCNELDLTNNTDNLIVENCLNDAKEDSNNNMDRIQQSSQSQQVNESVKEDDLHLYNSYNYWYISPDLPLDPNIVNGGETICENPWNIDNAADVENSNNVDFIDSIEENSTSLIAEDKSNLKNDETEVKKSDEEDEEAEQQDVPKLPEQTIVPQLLIDNYALMAIELNSIHKEIPYYCAYSLPAVALTIGQPNWHLLKNTVELLASHIQYKVRLTIASSLHELAKILGPDIATDDLTPLFDDFLKDLDMVKIGMLKHLGDFLKLIKKTKRNSYLPRLTEFLKICNETNWRYVEEFLKQLLYLMELNLFKPMLIAKHVSDYCCFFLADNIAALRDASLKLTTEFIKYISNKEVITSSFLVCLAEQFAHSKNWKHRQTFALLCCQLVSPQHKALSVEQFTNEMLPHLLDLSWDPVANVRLVVARTISQNYYANDYFQGENVEMVLRRLQADKDRDVRQSAKSHRYLTN